MFLESLILHNQSLTESLTADRAQFGSVGAVPPPLLYDLLSQPGGHADDGGGEEQGGRQVEGVVLAAGLVNQPASDGRS